MRKISLTGGVVVFLLVPYLGALFWPVIDPYMGFVARADAHVPMAVTLYGVVVAVLFYFAGREPVAGRLEELAEQQRKATKDMLEMVNSSNRLLRWQNDKLAELEGRSLRLDADFVEQLPEVMAKLSAVDGEMVRLEMAKLQTTVVAVADTMRALDDDSVDLTELARGLENLSDMLAQATDVLDKMPKDVAAAVGTFNQLGKVVDAVQEVALNENGYAVDLNDTNDGLENLRDFLDKVMILVRKMQQQAKLLAE